YEFRCPDGHQFEKFYRKISDAMELPCPECGKLATRLVSGGAGLLFKGSGFYLTDYGKNAHRKAAPASGESKGGDTKNPEPAGTASSESKGSDTKASEAKPTEAKSTSESKPAKKPSSGTPKSET
ncbi:MAG TPA: zinc ribbon domain-containing protein, partial [Gemmatimonadaceae bacterium]|nr:zinc ribbon domain-containing protein [Gemmatimonadaceae bacterium]